MVTAVEELCEQIRPDMQAYVTWEMVRAMPASFRDPRLARLADRGVRAVSGIAKMVLANPLNARGMDVPEVIDAICAKGVVEGGALWEIIAGRWEDTRRLIKVYQDRRGKPSTRAVAATQLRARGFL